MAQGGKPMRVKMIRITSALPESADSYLQVGSLAAVEAGTGADVALASAGATALAADSGFGDASPSHAIAGRRPVAFPHIYHSASPATTEFLLIVLARPTILSRVVICGRADAHSDRDVYHLDLLDAGGNLLFTVVADGSREQGDAVIVEIPPEPTPVGRPFLARLFGRA